MNRLSGNPSRLHSCDDLSNLGLPVHPGSPSTNSTMKYARLHIARQGDKQTVASLFNSGGSFVHIKPDGHRHRSSKLIIRRAGSKEIRLDGRQIASLKRVLEAV